MTKKLSISLSDHCVQMCLNVETNNISKYIEKLIFLGSDAIKSNVHQDKALLNAANNKILAMEVEMNKYRSQIGILQDRLLKRRNVASSIPVEDKIDGGIGVILSDKTWVNWWRETIEAIERNPQFLAGRRQFFNTTLTENLSLKEFKELYLKAKAKIEADDLEKNKKRGMKNE